ncbi:uncharacterized protein NP_2556A [Natronomonas pharaonis DSM 2160]|uniref:Uncharacterized protein n=1 Tax=Natronomonas pharaonis (strain ATCC 35678 / DSM 2160 / CIP 103997 / JCM 8858 / NBRC 14720 / NCIMB 2260 / Gabara) TaxID=348780 RepID=A0A1U7EWA8_NATPD|nr:hypothetical protein [Natronomonas pharaonis]CAI49369.1 uncharacterized protein NP_2556A [Natronomonas pharaonis DSM 2160]
MVDLLQAVLISMRLLLFGLTLGLTIISFQAYRKQPTERLQYAFIGFAFLSMGVGVTNLTTQLGVQGGIGRSLQYFQIAETVPFIVGFAMIYASLYR